MRLVGLMLYLLPRELEQLPDWNRGKWGGFVRNLCGFGGWNIAVEGFLLSCKPHFLSKYYLLG